MNRNVGRLLFSRNAIDGFRHLTALAEARGATPITIARRRRTISGAGNFRPGLPVSASRGWNLFPTVVTRGAAPAISRVLTRNTSRGRKDSMDFIFIPHLRPPVATPGMEWNKDYWLTGRIPDAYSNYAEIPSVPIFPNWEKGTPLMTFGRGTKTSH
jgi:hypothetical protein